MDGEGKRTIQDLQQMQAAPLGVKIGMTIERIRNWVDEYGVDGVCISFSGGKDSAVLMDIARKVYPNMKAAFVDTGLEYPEIREWVKQTDNVEWIKPKLTFKQVIKKYGYPFISKEVSEVVEGAKVYINGGGRYSYYIDRLFGRGRYKKQISVRVQQANGFGQVCEAGEHKRQNQTGRGIGTGTLSDSSDVGGTDQGKQGESGDYP